MAWIEPKNFKLDMISIIGETLKDSSEPILERSSSAHLQFTTDSAIY